MYAKYFIETKNLEMVDADADSEGKCWTLKVAADPNKRVLRQLRKKKHDTPGIDYSMQVKTQFKFVPAEK